MAQPLCLEAKRCSRLVRYAVASLFLLSPARAWATTLSYRVWLSALEIGTYTNAISHSGDEDVIVTTRLRINVLWGVRRESSDRVARWRGGRLMTFDSSTTWSDGSQSSVHGEAQGNKFQITVPGKPTVLVPPDVFPSNPWSPDLVNASWIMAENTGLAEPSSQHYSIPAPENGFPGRGFSPGHNHRATPIAGPPLTVDRTSRSRRR